MEVVALQIRTSSAVIPEGGRIKSRKGVNIPNKSLDLEYISEADRNDILFGIEMDVDYVAASFVRSGRDVAN